MNVWQANVTGLETVRWSRTEVRCNLPLVIDPVLPKGLQQQGNP